VSGPEIFQLPEGNEEKCVSMLFVILIWAYNRKKRKYTWISSA